jgi:hypothetical protein
VLPWLLLGEEGGRTLPLLLLLLLLCRAPSEMVAAAAPCSCPCCWCGGTDPHEALHPSDQVVGPNPEGPQPLLLLLLEVVLNGQNPSHPRARPTEGGVPPMVEALVGMSQTLVHHGQTHGQTLGAAVPRCCCTRCGAGRAVRRCHCDEGSHHPHPNHHHHHDPPCCGPPQQLLQQGACCGV